jgi:hypothetical protein
MPRNINIQNITFRNKSLGWKHKSFSITAVEDGTEITMTESSRKNAFMKGFLYNLYLRPSCYKCPSKSLKSGSDITLGDYWGIQNIMPEFDDDKGVSLVLINSLNGKYIYDQLDKDHRESNYNSVLLGNKGLEKSAFIPKERNIFFQKWQTDKIIPLITSLTRSKSFSSKIISIVAVVLRKIGLYSIVKGILKK